MKYQTKTIVRQPKFVTRDNEVPNKNKGKATQISDKGQWSTKQKQGKNEVRWCVWPDCCALLVWVFTFTSGHFHSAQDWSYWSLRQDRCGHYLCQQNRWWVGILFCSLYFCLDGGGARKGRGERDRDRDRERERDIELKNFILQGLRQRELACWLVTLVRYTGNHLTWMTWISCYAFVW